MKQDNPERHIDDIDWEAERIFGRRTSMSRRVQVRDGLKQTCGKDLFDRLFSKRRNNENMSEKRGILSDE
jgi:hypothetical protein